jgi:preprotein translocase subunit SecG
MAVLLSVLILLVCVLLTLVVLVQNSKGGGLASNFSSSNQVMGVRKTADVLEKATWTFAVALFVLCIISTAYTKPAGTTEAAPIQTESQTKNKAGDFNTTPPPVNPSPVTPGTTGPGK